MASSRFKTCKDISRRKFVALSAKWISLLSIAPVGIYKASESLARNQAPSRTDNLWELFSNPPSSARPWVYWWWLDGNMTKEGITADLESMKAVGIGGALIQNGDSAKPGPIRFMTPEWQEIFDHTVTEAARLDLEIAMSTNDGYDCGGPWITPEHAMQELAWSETFVQGPQSFSAPLPAPSAKVDYYRDIAVIAFPAPKGHQPVPSAPKVTVVKGNPSYIQHEYAQPFAAKAIAVGAPPAEKPWELHISDDGESFQQIVHLRLPDCPPSTFPLEPVRARFFRLVAPSPDAMSFAIPNFNNGYNDAQFAMLSDERVPLWEEKAGVSRVSTIDTVPMTAAAVDVIHRDAIVDLTSRMDPSGHINWNVPAGDWIVLRIGHRPTGRLVSDATREGLGLAVDALSRNAIEAQFPFVMGKLINDSKNFVGKSFAAYHIDSWEAMAQNWTPAFRSEFLTRRGYDLAPFFPVLSGGRIVDSLEISERFLWDFRRTISDLIAENFYGGLTTLCHKHGLRFVAQASESQTQFMTDALLFQKQSDLPTCEFWLGQNQLWPNCTYTPSAAHIYGKKVVGAESYTSETIGGDTSGTTPGGRWREHPFVLKRLGDQAFTGGINRFHLAYYIQQPRLNEKPGLVYVGQPTDFGPFDRNREPPGAVIGSSFQRTQTWWLPGSAWMRYLARCQYLLQEGRFVADLCVLLDEGVPVTLPSFEGLHPGYRFDCINHDVLLQAQVKDGRIEIPSGMSYRVLVLTSKTMTPELVTTIHKLAQDGATIVGPRPVSCPSLTNHPHCDASLSGITENLWANGKISAQRLPDFLSSIGLAPDFEYTSSQPDANFLFMHRIFGHLDVYFVSNQSDRFEEVQCAFRIGNRQPEIWDPDSALRLSPAVFRHENGRTIVPLRFEPYGSIFVAFRRSAHEKSVTAVTKDGQPFSHFASSMGEQCQDIEVSIVDTNTVCLISTQTGVFEIESTSGKVAKVVVPPQSVIAIDGPWKLEFPPNWGAPEKVELSQLRSWSAHEDEGVRHFSGTATYIHTFNLPADVINAEKVLYLDLGKVAVMAEIIVNEQPLGVQWKPPYRVDISGAARVGTNRLEVRVTNLWVNRLIGDQSLPERERFTHVSWEPYTKDDPLVESGLLGPVRIYVASKNTLHWI